MLQSCTFVKGIECQPLNERDAINQYIVALRSKLYRLGLLTSDYGSDVGFAHAYDSVRYAFARITTFEVALLLTRYPRDSYKHVQLPIIQQLFVRMNTQLSADFTEYLIQQCKQSIIIFCVCL